MSEYILITKQNGKGILTLNRPDKRNAMNGRMIKEILHALDLLRLDDSVQVLIIQGQGEHFNHIMLCH